LESNLSHLTLDPPYPQMSPSAGLLEVDDVLLAVDGEEVANDGTVSFRGWERVAFDHLISLKEPGQEVALKVRRRVKAKVSPEETALRVGEAAAVGGDAAAAVAAAAVVAASASAAESEVVTVLVAVHPRKSLVPVHQYDRLPSYYVFAGLLFSPLTQPLLHEWGDDWYNLAPRWGATRTTRKRFWGAGCGVQGAGYRVWGCRVHGPWFRGRPTSVFEASVLNC